MPADQTSMISKYKPKDQRNHFRCAVDVRHKNRKNRKNRKIKEFDLSPPVERRLQPPSLEKHLGFQQFEFGSNLVRIAFCTLYSEDSELPILPDTLELQRRSLSCALWDIVSQLRMLNPWKAIRSGWQFKTLQVIWSQGVPQSFDLISLSIPFKIGIDRNWIS
jgi:hypothetical protein